jgi:hypothetical protein
LFWILIFKDKIREGKRREEKGREYLRRSVA